MLFDGDTPRPVPMTSLEVDTKLMFFNEELLIGATSEEEIKQIIEENAVIVPATTNYIYDPVDRNNCKATVSFNNTFLADWSPDEKTKATLASLKRVKIRYDEYETGKCIASTEYTSVEGEVDVKYIFK